MPSGKSIKQIAGLLTLSLLLFACKEKKQAQAQVHSQEVASAIIAQANEPLQSASAESEKQGNGIQITQLSLKFVNLLIDGKYEQARQLLNPSAQKKYPVEKLQANIKKILKQTGKNPKTAENSLIIDKTLARTDRKGVADVYVSIKGDKGLKALYVNLCSDTEKLQVCHIGWGTEDNGEV